jgi:hypothetical protein
VSAPVPATVSAPAAAPVPAAAAAPVSAAAPVTVWDGGQVGPAARLLDVWPDLETRCRLPPKLRAALVGGVLLLLAIIGFGNRGAEAPATTISPIDEEMVVSADDLKNRREVRPDDFRPRDGARPVVGPPPAPVAVTPAATPEVAAETLAERRARRRNDPEDILTLKARRGATPRAAEAPWYDGPIYVTAGSSLRVGAAPQAASASVDAASRRLAAAATTIPATLTSPLELRGEAVTVIARADDPASGLGGARFIGTASRGTGRVTIRFRSIVLADGREARVEGEAQDTDGVFGIRVESESSSNDEGRGSAAGEAAEEAATDVLSSALGGGIAGRAVDRYVSRAPARHSGGTERLAALPAGTKLLVFLHEPLELGR